MKRSLTCSLMLVITVSLLGACKIAMPGIRPWGMAQVPEGTPIFRKGWEEGCNSGLSAYGGKIYRDTYDFYQELTLLDNKEYYTAWKDGYSYCRWYVWNFDRPGKAGAIF